jgi:TonB family protein
MNLRDDEPIRPFAPDHRRLLALGGGWDPARLEDEAARDRADRRRLTRIVIVAAALHLALLAIRLPDLGAPPLEPAAAPRVFVIQPVRFQPPPPAAQREIPKPKVKRVPVPDPTPDDPEPIRVERELPVELDLPPADALFAGIPDGPPGPPRPALPAGILEVGGEVTAPVKLHAPRPLYTEEARAARLQGVVIVRAIIDADGSVRDVEVLKGLPLGLAERTVEAVREWRFEPALRGGVPVPVFFNITVSFTVQ